MTRVDAPRILLVDDNESVREALADVLSLKGFEVVTAIDGIDALDRFQAEQVDIIVTDMQMPRCDGAEFLFLLANRVPQAVEIPVFVQSAAPEMARSRLGHHGYKTLAVMAKPVAFADLLGCLHALEKGREE